jgi:aryl-alcohol dehydrogenase-like predicted oxidoreductase
MPRFDAPSLPLCLGGNVFGWTADEDASFAVLDAFAAGGGTLIDTADGYSSWVDGHEGGESEAIIGRWLEHSGRRDDMVVITKVGAKPDRKNLGPDTIRRACEESLARLRTDRIDLYFAHFDDAGTPLEDTFGAFEELLSEGVIGAYGLSNYEPDRLRAALAVAPHASALQPRYNLVERETYEAQRRAIAEERGLAVLPYYGLASGFLSGKYRSRDAPGGGSPRAPRAAAHLESERGPRVLEALDAVAAEHNAPVAAVALAWVAAQPTITAPIASARSTEQLAELMRLADVRLTGRQLELLDTASR